MVSECVCVCVCVCVFVCLFVCLFACLFVCLLALFVCIVCLSFLVTFCFSFICCPPQHTHIHTHTQPRFTFQPFSERLLRAFIYTVERGKNRFFHIDHFTSYTSLFLHTHTHTHTQTHTNTHKHTQTHTTAYEQPVVRLRTITQCLDWLVAVDIKEIHYELVEVHDLICLFVCYVVYSLFCLFDWLVSYWCCLFCLFVLLCCCR